MGYALKLEMKVMERFKNDIASHVITEKHRDGLYGHWRCQKGSEWNLWFDIVTIPGMLMITGDMGDFAFKRVEDMIGFMRGSAMSYSYAAEKCIASDGRIKEYSPELFREALDQMYEDYKEDREDKAGFKRSINSLKSKADDGETFAMIALYESELFDGADLPSCKAYTYHFLWCLHAIKWFCDQISEPAVAGPEAAATCN